MPIRLSQIAQSSLCRFRPADEALVSDEIIKGVITQSFLDHRAFPFFPDLALISAYASGADPDAIRQRIAEMRDVMFDSIAKEDMELRRSMASDLRLSSRIWAAMAFIHRALSEGIYTSLHERRFVLVKEKRGSPTIHHPSNETTVIAHIGQGPYWTETPTIYLGMKLFDALAGEEKRRGIKLFDAFIELLRVEERAIETGYAHTEAVGQDAAGKIDRLIDEVIRISSVVEIEYGKIPEARPVKRFTARDRKALLDALDARLPESEMDFDYDETTRAAESLEKLARRYKKSGDEKSLREVVRLLVAASGHDIHEVRNRANIVLERVLAPKEFDAPLATSFFTLQRGGRHHFEFDLPGGRGESHFVRLYRNACPRDFVLEKHLDTIDLELRHDPVNGRFTAEHIFNDYGHCDFLVFRRKKKQIEWLTRPGCSGRINVISSIRGHIILEIFPDIHGHTQAYWMDDSGHPGMVYNEHGEVIRLGRFSDITAHLEDIKERYNVTALYLLGVQQRGSNREDWAPNATSPSPFAPMSLTAIDAALGGEEEFMELVRRAHELDMKIIIDVVPHLNRRSTELPDECAVKCYDDSGNLVLRGSTDGRYGSWNDGKLFNYRKLEVWEWLRDSILTLIDRYDIDGIRFDSAHAVPIMMKKNNYPFIHGSRRSSEDMVEGGIIVNDREDEHFQTTGYYDCACRDMLAIPLHYHIMTAVEKKLREKKKTFFVNLAECFWGHERFLTRTGIIPYNSTLFKICEEIIHGKSDVREIYRIYNQYFPSVLPPGTELLGILGNHDERRALNTFGQRGLRAAVVLTSFMNNILMDYEGSAEGEGWKVFLDNIYVNWNQFEYASHRSLERFYRTWYRFHRENIGDSHLIWAGNPMVAAAMKFTPRGIWIGVFNFSDRNEHAALQFDNPALPIKDEDLYSLEDPVYSPITGQSSTYTGRELRVSKVYTTVSFTERIKLLKLEKLESLESRYGDFLRDSFFRLCTIDDVTHFKSNFAFLEIARHTDTFERFASFIQKHLIPAFWERSRPTLELGLKRALFHVQRGGLQPAEKIIGYIDELASHRKARLRQLGKGLRLHNQSGPLVFMSAEAEPFSKSGGLANVVYELPRELARLGEEVYLITPKYRQGDDISVKKMNDAAAKYGIAYTGTNVRFKIQGTEYEVGVHYGEVDGVRTYMIDHHEFFDGLYWGYTAEEKLRRRVAFARACAEVICTFGLRPHFTFTNDAFAGIFNGIVRSDPLYRENPNFQRTTFLHIIHNGGWQYFDSYRRWEGRLDLFSIFNLPHWRAVDFSDPVFSDSLNCMATGIRFADRVITVSPTYARQIEFACDGLERILRDVVGISNAIGSEFKTRLQKRFDDSGFVDTWYTRLLDRILSDPEIQEKIAHGWPEILKGPDAFESIKDEARRYAIWRMRNKLMLQLQRGLRVDPDAILFTMIHRITEQKGFQLLLEASREIFTTLGFQGVLGGSVSSGDQRGEELARGIELLTHYYPDSVCLKMGYQDVSVPLLSSDIFLMPSMSEPGGISQLEALAGGCLVVARATGGLRDTIHPLRASGGRVEGNGFLCSDFNAWSFLDAMRRCAAFIRSSDERTLYQAHLNAENSIYHWDRPAMQYIDAIYAQKELFRRPP